MYTQFAQGSFSTDVHGPFHCGPNHETPKRFDFEVTVTYPADALDESGFLLDNQAFKSYFESIGNTNLSCELLAKAACEHFAELAGDRFKVIETGIWGIPDHAKIAYRIDRTQSQ
jgi:hypothetical protein